MVLISALFLLIRSLIAPRTMLAAEDMKSSRKPGKFYCAKNADDGEYCRVTA